MRTNSPLGPHYQTLVVHITDTVVYSRWFVPCRQGGRRREIINGRRSTIRPATIFNVTSSWLSLSAGPCAIILLSSLALCQAEAVTGRTSAAQIIQYAFIVYTFLTGDIRNFARSVSSGSPASDGVLIALKLKNPLTTTIRRERTEMLLFPGDRPFGDADARLVEESLGKLVVSALVDLRVRTCLRPS